MKWTILIVALAGCQRDREACYALADANYWAVVESCALRRLSYDECPELLSAEMKLKEAHKGCP